MPKPPLTSRRRPEVVALALSPADPGAEPIDQHRIEGPGCATKLVMPPDPGEPYEHRWRSGGLCQTRSGCGRCVLSAGHYGDHDFGGAGRDASGATRGAGPVTAFFNGAIPWPGSEPVPVPELKTDYDAFLRRDLPRDRRAKALADTMRSLCREFALFAETPQSVSADHSFALASFHVGLRDVANAAGLLAQIEHLAAHPVTVRGDL